MAEIAIAAAGMVFSPIVQVFFERMLFGDFIDLFRGGKLDDRLLTRLKIKLMSANAVLKDAEDKQFTMPDVKVWVDAVYDSIYDAEQVLDEISTKAQQRKLDAEFGNFGSKVRNSISRSTSRFVKKVEKQIEELLGTLDFLVDQKENLGLREGVGGNPSERLPTTSLVDESRIFGRDDDKKAIINSLLSDGASGADETGVIAIVGMGGIGKTTLAQLVYNDEMLKDHFDHKAWVCVLDPFNMFMVMRTIIEAVTQSPCDIKDNLDQLQNDLKERLTGKKFLVVLDDVWEKNNAKWVVLRNALKFGAQRSKVIITTRDHEVARIMDGKEHPITDLSKEDCWLSKEDCWSLFAKYAFPNGNFNAYPQLEETGSQIVEKCKGLPLAITAIGGLLRSNLCVNEWDKILRSELWDLRIAHTDILPALILSYKYLPPPLRRCFAYCSIFPKEHAFKKDELILLWMAEGLLPQPQNLTMEEVGDDYFFALVSRSLFQRSKREERDEYVMHDLVSDLAKFISKEFTLCHKDDYSRKILSKTRHFSSSQNFGMKKLETFHESMSLRNSHIKRLSDSICKLCNLQILNVSKCLDLTALPRDMHKLTNLHHLYFLETGIMEMPINLGKLKCLQTLPRFIVGKHSGYGIEELGKLTNLHGSLSILKLQNVQSPTYAKGVNLSLPPLGQLPSLQDLSIVGLDGVVTIDHHFYGSGSPSMKPFGALKSLSFFHMLECKEWFPFEAENESRAFSNLRHLSISFCPKLASGLPAHLPSLAELSISNCPQLVASIPRTSSLCKLMFSNCNTVLLNQSPTGIQELSVTSCRELELPMHLNYSSLETLTLEDCGFLKSFPVFPKLRRLIIWNCEDLESLTVGEQHEQDLLLSQI
ncbi:putative disease resistance RPP13-like protein 1 [Alnus glutinosa]|uniref:putative disease resistance RPP13-like protein 1 n=1 Tax=Alnus glutinosa TaxID=3517 RepID=UPI002D79FA8B|nr:putative disease resistance RPP13-like protein 1 [Alnus glutinosa]